MVAHLSLKMPTLHLALAYPIILPERIYEAIWVSANRIYHSRGLGVEIVRCQSSRSANYAREVEDHISVEEKVVEEQIDPIRSLGYSRALRRNEALLSVGS